MGDGGETTILDLCGVEGNAVLGELESLLDEGGEFADTASLLSENFLGVGCADDDVGDGWGNTDFDTRVSLLSQLTLEELVQFGVENTIGDELSALGATHTKLMISPANFLVWVLLAVYSCNKGNFSYIAAPGTPEAMLSD